MLIVRVDEEAVMGFNFETPIFIVGAPRSGTTMLSVILDRHPNICIPPETQFFSAFLPSLPENAANLTPEELVDLALKFPRIQDLQLDKKDLLNEFVSMKYSPENLLIAILKCYCKKNGKVKFGEKSPKHLNYLSHIYSVYPKAKVICIVRDGRDVVRSLLKVKWAEPDNPRRFWIFCMEWNDLTKLSLRYKKKMSSDRFYLVKYEDIILYPEKELYGICEFLGEKFYSSQLSKIVKSNVVPEWEQSWKGNSVKTLDKSRIYAWRDATSESQIWAMNCMMGGMLKKIGYSDTGLKGAPVIKKLELNIAKIPYIKLFRPVSLLALKVIRALKP